MMALEKKTGVPNPRLQSRPSLRADTRKYKELYNSLNNSRGYNEAGLQPLRISEVKACLEISEIPMGFQASKALRIIQKMDSAHLEWWANKKNKNKK